VVTVDSATRKQPSNKSGNNELMVRTNAFLEISSNTRTCALELERSQTNELCTNLRALVTVGFINKTNFKLVIHFFSHDSKSEGLAKKK